MSASRIVTGGPPDTSIFFSLFCATKAMKRESRDQNGNVASSLPASGWATLVSSGRSQSMVRPDRSVATTASRRPSGDSAKRPAGLAGDVRNSSWRTIDVL